MRITEVNKCYDCKHHIHDDQEDESKWGKHWCEKLDVELKDASIIPDYCPLPAVDSDINSVIVHPHPIVSMRINNKYSDESGSYINIDILNGEADKIETSFFVDEDKANEIIQLMYRVKELLSQVK